MPYKDPEVRKAFDRKRDRSKRKLHATTEEGRVAKRRNRSKYNNSEKGKSTRKAYEQKNKLIIQKRNLEWEQERRSRKSTLKARWKLHLSGCIKRKLVNELSFEKWSELVQSPCFYCGIVHHKPSKINGIDRVDNDKGYTINNSVPCCWPHNHMKQELSMYEFIGNCVNVTSHVLAKFPDLVLQHKFIE